MKKIMILGSGGMLGHVVNSYLREKTNYKIMDFSFPELCTKDSRLLDATNRAELETVIIKNKPEVLINCIGILIRGSSEDPSNAIYLNSYLPHQLSKLQHRHFGRLIHISTDCVFSGEKGNYSENDFKDARDVYGLSKALGEVNNALDLTLRTSIIGPELKPDGEGLYHWFMRQKGEINGYEKAFWSGVTTLELARAIHCTIEQNLSGLYHITNNKKISKYELLILIKQIWGKNDISIIKHAGKIIDKSLLNTRKDFNFSVHGYKQMLLGLKEFMDSHKTYYLQYYH